MKILIRLLLCSISSIACSEDLLFKCAGAMGSHVRIDYKNMADYKVDKFDMEKDKVEYTFKIKEESPDILFFSSKYPKVLNEKSYIQRLPIIEKREDKIVALKTTVSGFWLYVIYPKSKIALYLNAESSAAHHNGEVATLFAKCD